MLKPLQKEPCSNEFFVTIAGIKLDSLIKLVSLFTCIFPPGGNRSEPIVLEAITLRPDSRVDESYYNVVTEIGIRPEAKILTQAKKARGSGGVEL